jgi:hypothetical protein
MFNFDDIDVFLQTETWDNRLRIWHKLGWIFIKEGMTAWVYRCFHEVLRLKEFMFEECSKAWEKQALGNDDLINSYRKSSNHLVVLHINTGYECVFNKTNFVKEKLDALARADMDKKTEIELELLRRSKFDCFVYLVEDLRNKTFKIGRSKTPKKRERTLQSEMPQMMMRFSIPADEAHEKQLHEHFQSKRLRGEWFMLTNDDLIWIVTFLKTNGDSSRAFVDYQWFGSISFASSRK